MATYFLCPVSTIFQWFTDVGIVLAGGKITTYAAGTSTPTTTWTDSSGGVANTNPIVLNSAGRLNNVQIWQRGGTPIKVVITDANNNQIGPTFDQIYGVGDPGSLQSIYYGGNDSGAANAYVLTFAANFNSYTNGIVVYWVPANTNSGASTVNINGIGVVNIVNADGSALSANQIVANQLAVIASQGGNFVLQSIGQQSGVFAPAWTGFGGSPPTGNMSWQVTGRVATLKWLGGQGTSTGNFMTISNLPTNLRPATVGALSASATLVIDNGADAIGSVGFGALGVVQFNKGTAPPSGTGFTAAGTKGIPTGWTHTYPLT